MPSGPRSNPRLIPEARQQRERCPMVMLHRSICDLLRVTERETLHVNAAARSPPLPAWERKAAPKRPMMSSGGWLEAAADDEESGAECGEDIVREIIRR